MALSDLGMIATSIGAITLIAGFLYSLYKVAKRIDGAIGVDSKGRTLSDRMDRVEHQLWENGGDSLADRVNSIEKCTSETNAQLVVIREILLQLVAPPASQTPAPRRRRVVTKQEDDVA